MCFWLSKIVFLDMWNNYFEYQKKMLIPLAIEFTLNWSRLLEKIMSENFTWKLNYNLQNNSYEQSYTYMGNESAGAMRLNSAAFQLQPMTTQKCVYSGLTQFILPRMQIVYLERLDELCLSEEVIIQLILIKCALIPTVVHHVLIIAEVRYGNY